LFFFFFGTKYFAKIKPMLCKNRPTLIVVHKESNNKGHQARIQRTSSAGSIALLVGVGHKSLRVPGSVLHSAVTSSRNVTSQEGVDIPTAVVGFVVALKTPAGLAEGASASVSDHCCERVLLHINSAVARIIQTGSAAREPGAISVGNALSARKEIARGGTRRNVSLASRCGSACLKALAEGQHTENRDRRPLAVGLRLARRAGAASAQGATALNSCRVESVVHSSSAEVALRVVESSERSLGLQPEAGAVRGRHVHCLALHTRVDSSTRVATVAKGGRHLAVCKPGRSLGALSTGLSGQCIPAAVVRVGVARCAVGDVLARGARGLCSVRTANALGSRGSRAVDAAGG